MKKVLITRRLIRESEDKASKLFDAKFNTNDELYSQKKIVEILSLLSNFHLSPYNCIFANLILLKMAVINKLNWKKVFIN